MSDEVDIANERRDQELANIINEFRYKLENPTVVFNSGHCRNCDETLDDGRAYCDSECASDFENRQLAIRRNGSLRGMI